MNDFSFYVLYHDKPKDVVVKQREHCCASFAGLTILCFLNMHVASSIFLSILSVQQPLFCSTIIYVAIYSYPPFEHIRCVTFTIIVTPDSISTIIFIIQSDDQIICQFSTINILLCEAKISASFQK